MRLWSEPETQPFVTAFRQAEVVRVVDGDTLDLRIDLGFDVQLATRIRLVSLDDAGQLVGVDAWETRGRERAQGKAAKLRVEELYGEPVRILSARGGSRGKYGRWLAAVLFKTDDGWRDLGQALLAEGHAEPWG